MLLQFYKKPYYVQIKSHVFTLPGKLKTGIFQLENKWYIRVEINDILVENIDNECMTYTHNALHSMYKSCNYENSILIKIPYRYKKFEAKCENCTFYDLCQDQQVIVSFVPVSLNLINEVYNCTFKLISLKLTSSMKHPHALLESA